MPSPILEARQVFLAHIYVYVKDADLGVRIVLQQILRVDAPLVFGRRLPSHRPGEILRIAESLVGGRDKELGHFPVIQVFLDSNIHRPAQALKNQKDLVALNELARLFDRFRGIGAIVIADELDLASVDAALRIDLVEVSSFGLSDDAVRRDRTTVRHGVADLYFGVAGARIVLFLSKRGACSDGRESENTQDQ